MSDDLLPYYNRELSYFRRMGAEFAEAHPRIASRLRLGRETAEDPHVSRLIESVAYLTARIRRKLDDDFPEITDSLLGMLYPHYLAPIPSAAVVQFQLDRSEGELTTGYEIPKGSMLETPPIDGEPCRFQTCYPVTLWPIDVAKAEFSGRPFTAPVTRYSSQAAAIVRIQLRCQTDAVSFDQFEFSHLRFFLNGQDQHVLPLYELLFNNVTQIVLARKASDEEPIVLDPASLLPVGFDRDEGLFPYPVRSFVGYRLLTEYFAFPQKFLFFDLMGLRPQALTGFGQQMEIYFYLDKTLGDLERNVTADAFRLGSSPVVNLFRKRAEPIKLSHTQSEYHVIADERRRTATEIFSVDRVAATSPDDDVVEFLPFYSFRHGADLKKQTAFWHSSRRAGERFKGQVDRGTEIFLSLVDLDMNPAAPQEWIMDVETTCLNRDLPGKLHKPRMTLTEGGPISAIACLAGPTPTRRPARQRGAMWRLLSHLSLNHLSITDAVAGPGSVQDSMVAAGKKIGPAADALREILKLYDFTDSEKAKSEIESVVNVMSRRVVGRTGGDVSGGFCRGVEVTLTFDEGKFPDHGVYLFASVIERFLALYTSINSFSQFVATTRQREGILKRWVPRAGEKTLL